MPILSSIGRIAAQHSAARARHRSERALLSLPPDLRKDIAGPKSSIGTMAAVPTDADRRIPAWRQKIFATM